MTDKLTPVRCGCGGEANIYVTHWWGKCYVCECDECGTASKPCTTEAEAIQAWNRAMSGSAEKSSTVERTAKVENIEDPAGLGAYGDCSECGAEVTEQYAYCPNCGCRLEWE